MRDLIIINVCRTNIAFCKFYLYKLFPRLMAACFELIVLIKNKVVMSKETLQSKRASRKKCNRKTQEITLKSIVLVVAVLITPRLLKECYQRARISHNQTIRDYFLPSKRISRGLLGSLKNTLERFNATLLSIIACVVVVRVFLIKSLFRRLIV